MTEWKHLSTVDLPPEKVKATFAIKIGDEIIEFLAEIDRDDVDVLRFRGMEDGRECDAIAHAIIVGTRGELKKPDSISEGKWRAALAQAKAALCTWWPNSCDLPVPDKWKDVEIPGLCERVMKLKGKEPGDLNHE